MIGTVADVQYFAVIKIISWKTKINNHSEVLSVSSAVEKSWLRSKEQSHSCCLQPFLTYK